MFSPIRTVMLHYPIRFWGTIFVIIVVYVYIFRYINSQCIDGKIHKKLGIVKGLLIYYVIALLFFTVIGRRSWDYWRYNWELGYSYREVLFEGNWYLAAQIISNVIAFIPLGALGSFLFKKKTYIKSFFCGLGVSLGIEFLQLILKRGYCEFDDIISNLLGIMVGCLMVGIYRFVKDKKARMR